MHWIRLFSISILNSVGFKLVISLRKMWGCLLGAPFFLLKQQENNFIYFCKKRRNGH